MRPKTLVYLEGVPQPLGTPWTVQEILDKIESVPAEMQDADLTFIGLPSCVPGGEDQYALLSAIRSIVPIGGVPA